MITPEQVRLGFRLTFYKTLIEQGCFLIVFTMIKDWIKAKWFCK